MGVFRLEMGTTGQGRRIMYITVKTEKTYAVVMTESQAINLLSTAATYLEWCDAFPDDELTEERRGERETLDDLRQVLLNAGVLLAGPKPEDAD